MAYRSTSIEVRPDTSVDFFENSDDHKAYIQKHMWILVNLVLHFLTLIMI